MISAAYMSLEGPVAASELDREVARLRAGDPDALAALLARYQNRLYRYLLRFVRERAVAEDLFQHTWLRVAENIHRYDPRRSFDAWLFSVAHNLAIDHLRRIRPASLDEETPDGEPAHTKLAAGGPDALDRALAQERAGLVMTALEEQPASYREVLSLRFEEEMKLEEIAAVLDVPLSTVKTRLRRGLERMKDALIRRAPAQVWREGSEA
jgi:RNA polymerase sigma-70 factor (ECF subfamily)